MKIKDCKYWPCIDFARYGRVPDLEHRWAMKDIREVHGLHQIEAMYVGATWNHRVVGTGGVPWKQLIHKGKKPC